MKVKKRRNKQEKCNRKKRILSIFMIIMLLSCYLNSVLSFAKTYNGQKAADYARQYALNPNSSYYDFGKVGYDYWQYSKSWSTVGGFYNYCMYHNGTVIIKKYDVSNKKSLESLKKSANVGDVLQINGNKEQHSVIVTQKKNNTLYYSGHSAGRDNENIRTFIDAALTNNKPVVIRIQFIG